MSTLDMDELAEATKGKTQIGWDKAKTLFYTVMTERLTETSDFAAYRTAVVGECTRTLTAGECVDVEGAFATVGL